MRNVVSRCFIATLCLANPMITVAQEQSVKPGINDSFKDPNVEEFLGRFEVESREIYAHRQDILEACELKPGQTVADIGAGTGLFTRHFAKAVGPEGRVIAVDIAQKFLDHIQKTCREANIANVDTLLCRADSSNLPAHSVDVVFVCDTYHHFEFPQKTLASIFQAVRPGGRLVVIDFRRVDGESTDWVMNHVRAGQEVFEAEISEAGFQKIDEKQGLLKENYFVVFKKPE
jgi:FkbM family methyltransferase